MLNYGDAIFICYYGSPKWLPACFGDQVWLWHPGSSTIYQKELKTRQPRQKPKGLLRRFFYNIREFWFRQEPTRFSDLSPIGRSLVLYEIEEDDNHEARIVQGLSKEQIETRISAIKAGLSGLPAEFDFGTRLRLSGYSWLRVRFALSSGNILLLPHQPFRNRF